MLRRISNLRAIEGGIANVVRVALFEPDIPQNTATLIRACACLGVPVDIIEPCGFQLSDRRFRRAGLDYVELADLTRHVSWDSFRHSRESRKVLVTPTATTRFTDFRFRPDDILVLGRESTGFPEAVGKAVADQVAIPMRAGLRSINVALAGAMVLGEALRQTNGFPT
jgi:tRNA (cytidine/uridine-2'-O-)-methyltransferase